MSKTKILLFDNFFSYFMLILFNKLFIIFPFLYFLNLTAREYAIYVKLVIFRTIGVDLKLYNIKIYIYIYIICQRYERGRKKVLHNHYIVFI